MNLADLSLARWRERRRTSDEPDFADMGTAFGLDASFGASAGGSAVIAERAPDLEPAPKADAEPAPRWWQRRGPPR